MNEREETPVTTTTAPRKARGEVGREKALRTFAERRKAKAVAELEAQGYRVTLTKAE